MSSLLTASEILDFQSIFSRHFDTFADVQIEVCKTPKITYSSQSNPIYAGYAESSQANSIILTPVSAFFMANIITNDNQDAKTLPRTKVIAPNGVVTIKVQQDCRDYIRNGKTELIKFYGNSYTLESTERAQNYLGLLYFYFELKQNF